MKQKILFTTILMIFATASMAQVIHVPADQPTIQAGIDAAFQGDTVLVAEGTYYENIRFMGKAITVASEFLMDGDESHIENTIIDGSQATAPDTASTVMFINGEDTTSIICGFMITGGAGFHDFMYDVQFGGGIAVMNAGAKIEHNIITLNAVDDDWAAGGCGIGAVSYLGDSWLAVRHNVITHNSATCTGFSAFGGGMNSTTNSIIQYNTIEYNSCENMEGDQVDGGGIEIEYMGSSDPIFAEISHNDIRYNTLIVDYVAIGSGVIIARASANIHHNNISYNTVNAVQFGNGAGIYVFENYGEVTIANNNIIENEIISEEWARGGAIGLWLPAAIMNIENNTIQGNTIDGMDNRGPGVWMLTPADKMNITGNLFKDNIGPKVDINSGAGGALCIMDAAGEVLIDRNIFTGNEIYNGGALYFRRSKNTVVTNNVFDGNKSLYGGGISFYDPDGKSAEGPVNPESWPVIANNTLINNEAQVYGGALYYYSNLVMPVLFNSIIRDNSSSTGHDIYSLTSAAYLVDHCNINTASISGNWTGDDNINGSPAFLDDSCHLASYCICVEAGTPSVTFNDILYSCPDHDIDGEGRPLNSTADIGVDEVLLTGLPENRNIPFKTGLLCSPNPFNDLATLEIELPSSCHADLDLYDVEGKQVLSILSEYLPGGRHSIVLNATSLKKGVYILELKTQREHIRQKLIHQ